jgi:hypothetical protein
MLLFLMLCGNPEKLMADAGRSWEDALPVQFAASKIEILSVRSTWASDFDYARQMQGPIYFNDCVVFENTSSTTATHIQFVFALVNSAGELKTPALPLDVAYSAEPNTREDRRANCRDHAYANGADGRWLVGWVNRVDFADGTSWAAPTGAGLAAAIGKALPHRLRF